MSLKNKAKLNNEVFDPKKLEKEATRDGLGKGILKAAESNKDLVVLSADLSESTRVHWFKERFPERYVELGVAEQNMATVASGLANYGKIPFMTSFGVFSPGRNYDQIRTTIALNDMPVKIASTHTGVSAGPDGATHQALEDIAMMRTMPNMTVVQPTDAIEAQKAVMRALEWTGPIYLRFARMETPVFTTPDSPFEIGRAEVLYESRKAEVALIACGPPVYNALIAAYKLKEKGVGSIVVNNHTIKPMNESAIVYAADQAGAVVTVEDHQKAGGMGSAVAEALSRKMPTPMEFVGVDDRFGQSGEPEELIEHYGLDVDSIVKKAKKIIKRK